MAEKIKIKGARQVSPKLRGLVALLIALLLAFPLSASASQSLNISKISCYAIAKNNYRVEGNISYGSNFTGNITNKDLSYVSLYVTFSDRNFKSGDSVSFNIADFMPVWVDSCDVEISCTSFIYTSDTDGSGRMYAKFFRTDYSSTSSVDVPIYTFNDDCKGYFTIKFTFNNFKIKSTYENDDFYYNIKINSTVSSESTSLLNRIIDFVKGIFDNIKELPSKIGDFFSNLVNNLKDWFASVGQWFTELGNKIKDFFVNLGDRIGKFFTNIFENIKEFFTNLFKPHDGYFDEVKDDLDKFLTEHLGIAYTLIPSLLKQTKEIITAVFNNGDDVIITFPALKVPIGDKTFVVGEAQSINFTDIYYHDKLSSVWLTLFTISDVVLSVGSALLFVRVVYKKFINKVGVEGGDEV